MDCLRCSTPLPPDLDTCPSCGAEAGLVPVRQVADAALLPLLKSVLEAAGVHYVVQGESALGMLPLGPLATGLTANLVAATILVPAHQAEQASELLAGASVPPADGEA